MDTQEHVHAFAETVVPATCQSSGYTLHRCDCGYEYKDRYTVAIDHQFEVTEVAEATCTEEGVQQLRCVTCGITETRKVPAKGHLWGDWNVQTLPTCTEKGSQTHTCTCCNMKETQEIKPIGHKLVNPKKSETQKGMVEWFCENCGQTIVKKSAAKRVKKPLIILGILALLIAIPIVLFSTVFKAEYHALMAKMYLSSGKYDEAYYQLKDLQRCCKKNCGANCEKHAETLDLLNKFYVLVGREAHYGSEGDVYSVNTEEYDEDDNRINRQSFDSDGNLAGQHTYGFDEDGKQISYEYYYEYNYSGLTTVMREKYEYSYDKDGKQTVTNIYDENDKLTYKYNYTYNEDGKLTSVEKYDASGNLITKEKHTYDKKGNRTSYTGYDAYGNLEGKYEYTYDKKGNNTSFAYYDADGSLQYMYQYTYDKNGNNTSSAYYGAGGNLQNTYKYTYDEDGHQTSCVCYSADGNVIEKRKYTYDKNGNKTSATCYDSEGKMTAKYEYEDYEIIYLVQD